MGLFNFFKRKKEQERYREKVRDRAERAKVSQEPALSAADESSAPKNARKTVKASLLAQRVLCSPHLTEKTSYLSDRVKRGTFQGGHYVFNIRDDASKPMIRRAIEEAYGVQVENVRIIPKRKKTRFMRGVLGTTNGSKRAVVILKKGDTIEFV